MFNYTAKLSNSTFTHAMQIYEMVSEHLSLWAFCLILLAFISEQGFIDYMKLPQRNNGLSSLVLRLFTSHITQHWPLSVGLESKLCDIKQYKQ